MSTNPEPADAAPPAPPQDVETQPRQSSAAPQDAYLRSKEAEPAPPQGSTAGDAQDVVHGESESESDSSGSELSDEEDHAEREEGGGKDDTSPIRRKRYKSRAERQARKGCKPGNQGKFHGEALAYLESLLDDYLAIDRRSRGKRKRFKKFWHSCTTAFWEKFDWKDYAEPEHKGVEDSVKWDTKLSIQSWYSYRAKRVGEGSKSLWTDALSALRAPQAQPPRKIPAWQLWAKQNASLVMAAAGAGANIGVRNKVATSLFKEQPDDIRRDLEEAATKQHEAAIAEHNAAKAGIASQDPAEQQKARDRLPTVVKPLLEKLCEYTGYSCISLIGGAVEGDKYKIGAVHHGEVQGTVNKNLSTFDPEGFRRDFVGHFFKFLRATKGSSEDRPNQAEVDLDSDQVLLATQDPSGPAARAQRATGSHRQDAPRPKSPVARNAPATSTAPRPLPPTTNSEVTSFVKHPSGNDPLSSTPINNSCSASPRASPQGESNDTVPALPPNLPPILMRKLDTLSGSARTEQIKMLASLNEYDLEREAALARKDELLSSLGLTDPSSLLSGSANARHTSPDSTTPGPDNTLDNPSPSLLDDTPSAALTFADHYEVDLTDSPQWVRVQYGILAAEYVGSPDRPTWLAALSYWIDLERKLEWTQMRAGLPAISRPPDVALWIQNARKGRIVVKQPYKYEALWWKWWNTMNPKWRKRQDERLLIGGTGDWSPLFKSGPNGFLSVLMSLVGLGEVTTTEKWRAALMDVCWVLREVAAARDAQRSTKRAAGDEQDNSSNDADTDADAASSVRGRLRKKRRL